MNIGFYSPYFDTLGGGERYVFTLASHWSRSHNVKLFWDDESIIQSAQNRFAIDLSRIKVTRNIFRGTSLFKKLVLTRQYDLVFFLSDGSIPSTLAKYNILHYQVPFENVPYSAMKLSRFQAIVCNSQFTKQALDARIGSHAEVIYPPVAPIDVGETKKEKVILSVGRFSGFHTAKKQHILLEAFARGIKAKRLAGWKLTLAGGLLPSDEEYFASLKRLARGLPVDLIPNAEHDALTDCYKRASLYWHAAGYGETDPRWMEHFGISTVEAMSAGVVPVVFAGGGHPEIVDNGKNGFLWKSISELVEKTTMVMSQKNTFVTLQKNAVVKSIQFSVSRFCDDFDALLSKITV